MDKTKIKSYFLDLIEMNINILPDKIVKDIFKKSEMRYLSNQLRSVGKRIGVKVRKRKTNISVFMDCLY